MPHIRLIDSVTNAPIEGAFAISDNITTHSVSDRDGARRILAYDLANTADPEWAAGILAAFDAGENNITTLNGPTVNFIVQYIP